MCIRYFRENTDFERNKEMKNYVVYLTATGVITRTGSCMDDDLSSQAGSGESVIEGIAETDGSEMVDIVAEPPVVISTPDWEEPTPYTPVNVSFVLQRAVITAVAATYFTCDLLDDGNNVISEDITVYPKKHLGTNALTGDVWPFYSVNDILVVYYAGGVWYCNDVFDDIEDVA